MKDYISAKADYKLLATMETDRLPWKSKYKLISAHKNLLKNNQRIIKAREALNKATSERKKGVLPNEALIEKAAQLIHEVQKTQSGKNAYSIAQICADLAKEAIHSKQSFLLRAASEQAFIMLKNNIVPSESQCHVFKKLATALSNISTSQCEPNVDVTIFQNFAADILAKLTMVTPQKVTKCETHPEQTPNNNLASNPFSKLTNKLEKAFHVSMVNIDVNALSRDAAPNPNLPLTNLTNAPAQNAKSVSTPKLDSTSFGEDFPRERDLKRLRSLILKYCQDSKLDTIAIPTKNDSKNFTKLIHESLGKIDLKNISKPDLLFIYRALTSLFLENPSLDYLKSAYQYLQQEHGKDYIILHINTIHLSVKLTIDISSDIEKSIKLNDQIETLKQITIRNFPIKLFLLYTSKILNIMNDFIRIDLTLPAIEEIVRFLLSNLINSQIQHESLLSEEHSEKMITVFESLIKQFFTSSSWNNFFKDVWIKSPRYFQSKYLTRLFNGISEQVETTVKTITWNGENEKTKAQSLSEMFQWFVLLWEHNSIVQNRQQFRNLLVTLFNKALNCSSSVYKWDVVMKGILDAPPTKALFNTSEVSCLLEKEKIKTCRLLCEFLYLQSLCKNNKNPAITFEELKKVSTLVNYDNPTELRQFLSVVEQFHTSICCHLINEPEKRDSIGKEFSEWLETIFNKEGDKISDILCEFAGRLMKPIPFYLKGLKVITHAFKDNFTKSKKEREIGYVPWMNLTQQKASELSKETLAYKIETQITDELKKIDCLTYPKLIQLMSYLSEDDKIDKAASGKGLNNLLNFFIDYYTVLAKSKTMRHEIQKYKRLQPILTKNELHKQCFILSSVTFTTEKFGAFYPKAIDSLKTRMTKVTLLPEYFKDWK